VCFEEKKSVGDGKSIDLRRSIRRYGQRDRNPPGNSLCFVSAGEEWVEETVKVMQQYGNEADKNGMTMTDDTMSYDEGMRWWAVTIKEGLGGIRYLRMMVAEKKKS